MRSAAGRGGLRYPSHSSYVHARQAMGGFSIWHWLIVLAVVLLIFGTKRLTSGAKDLGGAVKEFKKGMRDDDKPAGQLGDKRSEEHTSELQSLMRTSYAVFCLKKKNE